MCIPFSKFTIFQIHNFANYQESSAEQFHICHDMQHASAHCFQLKKKKKKKLFAVTILCAPTIWFAATIFLQLLLAPIYLVNSNNFDSSDNFDSSENFDSSDNSDSFDNFDSSDWSFLCFFFASQTSTT